jgi:hypothetical protein
MNFLIFGIAVGVTIFVIAYNIGYYVGIDRGKYLALKGKRKDKG